MFFTTTGETLTMAQATARARLRFMDGDEARRRIAEKLHVDGLTDCMAFCAQSLRICDAPGYRFQLEPSDINADARKAYSDAWDEMAAKVAPVGAKLIDAAATSLGCTISELWTRAGYVRGSTQAHGFGLRAGDESFLARLAVRAGLRPWPAFAPCLN